MRQWGWWVCWGLGRSEGGFLDEPITGEEAVGLLWGLGEVWGGGFLEEPTTGEAVGLRG